MSKKLDTKLEEIAVEKPFDFDTFELKTIDDFKTWNLHARKAFREAKKTNPRCDPPIPVRVPDESFHKKVKVKFQRFDQPENVLKVCVHNKDISWKGQLKPGGTYDLPLPVVKFLNRLAVPVFAEVKVENGGEVKTETKQVGERSRFSCQVLDLE
jgi:hypothetical protein